jgi:hypothetical protein
VARAIATASLVALLGLLHAPDAFAQASGDAHQRAVELKQQADAAFDARRFDQAVSLYDQSYAADPQPSILYDRGRAYQYLARYPEALDQLEQFAKVATPELRAKVPGFDALLADVRSHVATLDVRCEVPGARVHVGAQLVGTTPLPAPVRVQTGTQIVQVDADGYYPYRKETALPGGGAVTTLQATLVSRDKHGLLVVHSSVAGTSVSIDGSAVGVVPAEAALLEGTHAVLAAHEGFQDASTQIVLRAGEQKDITLDPQRKPSLFTRWWFWTGVGVLVVGAATAVTVYALTTEGPAPGGSFSPGTLRF